VRVDACVDAVAAPSATSTDSLEAAAEARTDYPEDVSMGSRNGTCSPRSELSDVPEPGSCDLASCSEVQQQAPSDHSPAACQSAEATGQCESTHLVDDTDAAPADDAAYLARLESELQLLRVKLMNSEEMRIGLERRLDAEQARSLGTSFYDISDGDKPTRENTDPAFQFKGTAHLMDCTKDSRRRAQGAADAPRRSSKFLRLSLPFKRSKSIGRK